MLRRGARGARQHRAIAYERRATRPFAIHPSCWEFDHLILALFYFLCYHHPDDPSSPDQSGLS